MKRWRTPSAKAGEIKIVYGKADRHSDPDMVVAWGAGTDMRCTARLFMSALHDKRMARDFPSMEIIYEPSLVEELEARGFDITTLRITIQKKT